MVVLGIATCDTTRKALAALRTAGHQVEFRDVRVHPLAGTEMERLTGAFGDRIINRASTTWRGLDTAARDGTPAALIAAHPTLMKRPVIDTGEVLHLGWTPDIRMALTGA